MDPNQQPNLRATLLRDTQIPRPTPPCSTSKPLHHNKKRRATDVYTHVSLHSAAAGSAARPASVVLSASTAAVKPHQQTST
ncbi:uncharacterized protein FTJAE_6904 [Fusarium tjaetaba]|uniref:Uncharacterized protein n=1 Tax=Fusarium tjaetaba TaxID=1567544 RepID=A0A8H5VTJ6_9HYPO|nr:uncharacterized protein FTJAE_6904 [Fusarium tjaetaba]KAF5633918.1 hypothetical protein FTJAE_6904 [Fusarium tjaetaba]